MTRPTCSFGPGVMPRAGQHVLRLLFDAKLFLDCVFSKRLDPVLIHHLLQILGRNPVITVQAVREIEYGLYLEVEKVPCGHIDHEILLILSVGDRECLPNIGQWSVESRAKGRWVEF